MKSLELNQFDVLPLNEAEILETQGGIFPIVICGVVITAKAAAAAATTIIFAAGVYAGYQSAQQ